MRWLSGLVVLFALGCRTEPIREAPAAGSSSGGPSSSAAPVSPASGTAYGKPIDPMTPYIPLAELLAKPADWNGKRVRTRGEVVAVCQNAGCWADLRPEGTDPKSPKPPTHVTMHDHAFFLPKDAKTKVAEIDGQVTVRALTQAECDHFNGEGANLVAGTPMVIVDAIGVVLR
ncbi:MAG: DUF4920 domain-containing protein [Myxococcales bacterium]|nr:DUF4920 domain-containing protein [Myxococcales bacterium]